MNVKCERKKIRITKVYKAHRANRAWAVRRIDYLFIYTNF